MSKIRFTKEQRERAIKMVQEQNLSVEDVAEQFGITATTLKKWLKKQTSIHSANLTGGKGFSFEDQVGAWFVVHLLAGVSPFTDKPGVLQSLAFQTEPDGWRLDDLLLTFKNGNDVHRYAISIKSNRQFSASKAPEDFVERCWQQFLKENNNPFLPKTDQLVNVTAELPSATRDSLSSLLNAAAVRKPIEMVKQLAAGDLSENARAMFNSFACPKELAKQHHVETEIIPELLRCIRVLPLDLENQSSIQKAQAIGLCRQILKIGDLQTATELWESLLVLVSSHRVDRGHIDLSVVLQALRHRFELKDHPDFSDDWHRLWNDSKNRWQSVIDKIGGKTSFPRTALLQTVTAKFADHQVVALLGEQGSGKSVAARRWVENLPQDEPILWLSPKTLEINDLNEFRVQLGLSHYWHDLLPSFAQSRMTVIIDGIDRLLLRPESIATVGQILLSLLAVNATESPFRILVICQELAWGEIQFLLLQAGIDATLWPKVLVGPVTSEELSVLITDFPSLHSLSVQERLKTILHQPKVLDCIARNSRILNMPDFRNWAGESDVIDWIWRTEITGKQQATSRQRLMWQLATKQAERFSVDVPLDELGEVADTALDSLTSDQICLSREGRVSFSHDLWGDWARQRLILAHEAELPTYLLAKLDNPTWYRSIVLFGLDMLERRNQYEKWLDLMNRSDSLQVQGALVCDLLLESLIRAAQTTNAFEYAWLHLITNDGKWLRRLLVRFLHIATSPNPVMISFAQSHKGLSESWASSVNRLPKHALWGPMLRFLSTRQSECVDLAPLQVAEIAERWLCWTGVSEHLRDIAADLALAVAWQSLRYHQHRSFSNYSSRWQNRGTSEEIAKKAYSAALQGIKERPNEVISFALCACGRQEPTSPPPPEQNSDDPEIQPRELPTEFKALLEYQSSFQHYEIEIPAWPDGPKWMVDDKFREICLQKYGLTRVIILEPNKAAEIILALVIRRGGTRLPENDYYHFSYHFELESDFNWSPPFYDKGPFLFFLNNHPEEGLDIIIKLVNFVTDRWLDLNKWRLKNEKQSEWLPNEKVIYEVNVPFDSGNQIWLGDRRWFFSYRDTTEVPEIIVSALMALEKWLYECIEQNQDIENIVIAILEKTRSLALAGLLIGVGKKETKLLTGPLLPFLSVIEIYDFDLTHIISDESHQMIGWGLRQTQAQIALAVQWHKMEHRKEQLEHVVFKLLLTNDALRQYFENVRLDWKKRLDQDGESDLQHDLLLRLYHQFDLNNWKSDLNSAGNILLTFQEPGEMLDRRRQNEKFLENRLTILSLPFKCRQIIDGERVTTEAEFIALWENGEKLFELEFSEFLDKQPLVTKEDLACGLIAAAVYKFRSWLKSTEDNDTGSLNVLLNVINNPPPRIDFDVADSVSNTHWDSFCADALPIFWLENINSPEIRHAIGLLVFSFHYGTVEKLFKHVASMRLQLSDDYFRLHHLLLVWSVLRHRFDILNRQLYGEESARREELLEKVNELLRQFIDRTLSPSVPKWKTLENTFIDNRPSLCSTDYFGRKEYHPRSPGIDLQLISSAFDSITDLDDARDENERNHWYEFWEQAVDTVYWMLGEANPEIEDISGTPYEFERWLFKRLPSVIISTRTNEEANKLWQPILELGTPAHYWLDDFFNDWWTYGLPTDPEKQLRFISIWKEMFEFTGLSPRWSSKNKRSWHLRKSRCALMGLGEITLAIDFWNESKSSIVQSITDEFQLWCEFHLTDVDCARSFITFLKKPAAQTLKPLGLVWLDQTIEIHGFWRESTKRVDSELAELLDNSWERIKNDNNSREVFLRLLRILVERHEPLALTIQERLCQ